MLGFLGALCLQLAVATAILIVIADAVRSVSDRASPMSTTCATFAVMGCLGYATFWLAYADYALLGPVKIIVIGASLVRFAWIVAHWRRARLGWLIEPVAFVTLFVVCILTIGYASAVRGAYQVDPLMYNRFVQGLPIDASIPRWFAEALARRDLSPFGDWHFSDRPPLQTGLYLWLTVRTDPLQYHIVSAWLQGWFIFGVWTLANALDFSTAMRRALMLTCCLLPVTIINTFFVWPKLLASAYVLMLFALLFSRQPKEISSARGALIGALACFAFLSHGASAFALVGLALAVVAFNAWPPLAGMVAGCATIATLYLPWSLFQSLVDPPGNRLLKWHLAGVIPVDGRSTWQALKDSYGQLGLADYVAGRIANASNLLGKWPKFLQPDIGATKVSDHWSWLPSLHILSFGLLAALVIFASATNPNRAVLKRLLLAVAASLLVFCILSFRPGETINSNLSYSVQLMAVAFTVAVLPARWLLLLIVAQAGSVVSVYFLNMLTKDNPTPLAAVAVLAFVTLFYLGFRPLLVQELTSGPRGVIPNERPRCQPLP